MNTSHVGSGLLGLLLCVGSVATEANEDDTPRDLGRIEFPNSGPPEAQEAFLRGVLLLHSFEYSDSAESFREAQKLDPDFALAYWGEASGPAPSGSGTR